MCPQYLFIEIKFKSEMCVEKVRKWMNSICGRRMNKNEGETENNPTPLPKKILSVLFGMLVCSLQLFSIAFYVATFFAPKN